MAGLETNAASLVHTEQHRVSTGLKRKRDDRDNRHDNIRDNTFDIRPVDDLKAVKTTLTSKFLLPRAHLPLSWLDPSHSGNHLYAADISLLESTYDRGLPPSVLIAEQGQGGRIFALERASQRRYVVFRLLSSLDSKVLSKRAVWRAPVITPQLKHAVQEEDVARAELRRKRRVAPIAVTDTHTTIEAPLTAVDAVDEHDTANHVVKIGSDTLDKPLEAVSEDHNTSVDPDEAFQELVKHYLDALYLSKTSLAYFVKGPLARIRSLATEPVHKGLDATQLIAFLREIILSISTTDQRHKEDIPSIIRDSSRDTDADGTDAKRKNKKRKWKSKRDRQGFFVGETEHIQEWWQTCDTHDATTSTPQDAAGSLKHALETLRTRETFSQVIIALEILALESIPHKDVAEVTADTTAAVSTEPVKPARKAKKPLQLDNHLDILLDRLVIWHSLSSQTLREALSDESANGGKASDELRDFCIEVIIPFFLPRLPKIAASANKKLGGPSARSPLKRQSSNRRPGQPAVRHSFNAREQSRSSRQEAPADKDHKPALHPSLRRSVTDSQLSESRHSRRDSSASVSMASVKTLKPDARRPVSSALDSLTRREIDLTAASASSKERLRKKTEQEARIREAVAGIRKPDRTTALQENAALVDAKFAQHLQRSRKPAHTTKRPDAVSGPDVHIQATPRLSRAIAATPRHPSAQLPDIRLGGTYNAGSYLAASHVQSIPQTGHRERQLDMLAATPSREPNLYHVSDSVSRIAFDKSPLLSRTRAIESTPSRPRTLFSIKQTPVKDAEDKVVRLGATTIDGTPAAAVPLGATCPNAGQSTTRAEEKSIYDVLGWNDESYEELA